MQLGILFLLDTCILEFLSALSLIAYKHNKAMLFFFFYFLKYIGEGVTNLPLRVKVKLTMKEAWI